MNDCLQGLTVPSQRASELFSYACSGFSSDRGQVPQYLLMQARRPVTHRHQQADDLSKIRIRLADDNQELPMTVKQLLEATYDVVGSSLDGQSLIDPPTHLRPDIIITDVSMHVLGGMKAAHRLNEL
jgi:PleD family two-component response regulator